MSQRVKNKEEARVHLQGIYSCLSCWPPVGAIDVFTQQQQQQKKNIYFPRAFPEMNIFEQFHTTGLNWWMVAECEWILTVVIVRRPGNLQVA